jgi:sugar phosphate permease
MSFWFKQSVNPSYTVEQINYYSVGISGVQIVSALGFAWVSDHALKGKRWPPLVFVAVSVPDPQPDIPTDP